MNKFAPGKFDLRVKRGMSGRGLFAYSPIKKGACIVEYFGRTLSEKEEYSSRSLYLFEASKTKTIDGNVKGNIAKYINHSCKPNCEAETYKSRVYIMAKRNIKVGEELAYDYGKDFWDYHINKKKGCRCGKHSCAGVLSTKWEHGSMGTISGIEFKAEMAFAKKDTVVTFLVRSFDFELDDLPERWGRGRLEDLEQIVAKEERPQAARSRLN